MLIKKLTPVTLAPGRLRLETRPNFTESPPIAKTMGIVLVAALAANPKANLAGGGPAGFKARQELGVGEGACLPSLTFPVSLNRDETGATAVNPLGELH